MDKKFLYYVFGFIGAFILLIFLDKIVMSDYQNAAKKSNIEAKITEIKVSPTPTKAPKVVINDDRIYSNNDKQRMAAYLESYMELINKKDYKKAYELLKADYKKERFSNLEAFTNYLKKNFNRQYAIKIKILEKKDDLFIVDANLIAKQYTQEEIIQGIRYNSDIFVINEKARGDFEIAFGSFIDAKQINSEHKINDKITVRLIKQVRHADNIKYLLMFKNETDKPLNLLKDNNKPNIYLSDLFGKKIETQKYQLNITNTKINPKEPTLVEISFANHYTTKFIPFKISFENATFDDANFIQIDIFME